MDARRRTLGFRSDHRAIHLYHLWCRSCLFISWCHAHVGLCHDRRRHPRSIYVAITKQNEQRKLRRNIQVWRFGVSTSPKYVHFAPFHDPHDFLVSLRALARGHSFIHLFTCALPQHRTPVLFELLSRRCTVMASEHGPEWSTWPETRGVRCVTLATVRRAFP